MKNVKTVVKNFVRYAVQMRNDVQSNVLDILQNSVSDTVLNSVEHIVWDNVWAHTRRLLQQDLV